MLLQTRRIGRKRRFLAGEFNWPGGRPALGVGWGKRVDVLDVSLCDVELLGEVVLTSHLIVAANESGRD